MPADLGTLPLHETARRSPSMQTWHLLPAALPHWRAMLGCRWQEHYARVSELSQDGRGAVRGAAEAASQDAHQAAFRRASAIWHQAVAEWRVLTEIEAALSRLSAGQFGWCQQCGSVIAFSRLAEVPYARYCPACDQ
jgi:DnaK suppressor protein